ncbi:MAG TPA: PRD domain-containing protein, partial [Firmicutes bacterium]|nr:PRD domain-containing protein [Candidatus Fermentithermobacillaceae bacterium]
KEQYKTVRESMPATGNRGVIMTVCPTGAGTATKIRDLILDKLSIARTMDVIPVSALEDIDEAVSSLGNRLCVVVGSIDPEIDDVPFVGVDEILSDEGLKRVERLLKGWDSSELTGPVREVESREDILSLIRSQMHRFVSSVTPEEAEIVCDTVLRSLENEFYARALPVDLMSRVYLHTACMVDRIASGNELELPAWGENERKRRKDEFAQLKQILDNAGARVDLKVPESEIDYFLAALPSN